jgi:hypothetical protein
VGEARSQRRRRVPKGAIKFISKSILPPYMAKQATLDKKLVNDRYPRIKAVVKVEKREYFELGDFYLKPGNWVTSMKQEIIKKVKWVELQF